MKKIGLLIIILTLSNSAYCQDFTTIIKKTPKYGIMFSKKNNKPYWNQRKHFKYYLSHYNRMDHPIQDRCGKLYCDYLQNMDTLSGRTRLPDSIQHVFIIKRIEKKKDNYQIRKGHLRRTAIYLIDIEAEQTSSQYPPKMRVLSVDNVDKKTLKKIKLDSSYRMIVYPFFYVDASSAYFDDGKLVNPTMQPLQSKYPIIYDNIWIPYLDFTPYNWFWSPNIVGIFYNP